MQHACPLCQHMVEVDLNIPCPVCGSQLAIKTNRKSGRQFIGCTGYNTPLQCRWALSIPRYLIYSADLEAVRGPVTRYKGDGKAQARLRKITIGEPEPELNDDEETLTPA